MISSRKLGFRYRKVSEIPPLLRVTSPVKGDEEEKAP
jgi:hypothetical protein